MITSVIMLSAIVSQYQLRDFSKEPWYIPPQEPGLELGLELAAGVLVKIFIHEGGHYLAVSAYDSAEVVEFRPYPGKCNGKFKISGCIRYSVAGDNLRAARMAVAPTGILATRMFASSMDYIADQEMTGPRTDQFMGAMYITTRFDGFFYVIKCAAKHWVTKRTNVSEDPQAIAESLTGNRRKQDIIYISMLAMVTLDVIIGWDDIKQNWDRLWLK